MLNKNDKIMTLAKSYRSKGFIVGGIDSEAQKNNRLVIKALGEVLKESKHNNNDIFAIHMGGSRVKGYNTKDSDIDIILATPDTIHNDHFIHQTIQEELEKKGIKNRLDWMIGQWAGYNIKTDPNNFISTVDQYTEELISLFGYTIYHNPNLFLSKLAFLEVIKKDTYGILWDTISGKYADTYLNEREHITEKIAERLELSTKEVAKLFTKDLFKERYKKFGLSNPLDMHKKLEQWYKNNKKDLGSYVMRDVYEEVKELLDKER